MGNWRKIERAALYCRSAVYDDERILKQLEKGWEFTRQMNLSVEAEYIDNGVSARTENRFGLNQLMHDANSDSFNVVIATDISRLSRSVSAITFINKMLTLDKLTILIDDMQPPFDSVNGINYTRNGLIDTVSGLRDMDGHQEKLWRKAMYEYINQEKEQ